MVCLSRGDRGEPPCGLSENLRSEGVGVGVRMWPLLLLGSAWFASSAAMEGPREGWREDEVEKPSLRWVEGGEEGREKVETVLSVMEDTCSAHSTCSQLTPVHDMEADCTPPGQRGVIVQFVCHEHNA